MSTTKVATIVTCWALLLLTMFPVHAIAGRQVPAPLPPASSTQTSIDVVPAPASGAFQGLDNLNIIDSQLQKMPREPAVRDSAMSVTVVPIASSSLNTIRATSDSAKMRKLAEDSSSIYGHRLLVGSSPPTCQGKCGSCNPCNPIHVSIGSPHGALKQQEYYPEVWRCKCGNKLFMP